MKGPCEEGGRARKKIVTGVRSSVGPVGNSRMKVDLISAFPLLGFFLHAVQEDGRFWHRVSVSEGVRELNYANKGRIGFGWVQRGPNKRAPSG